MPSNHIDDGARYKKWCDAARPTIGQLCMGVLNQRQPANAGANHATNAHGVIFSQSIAGFQAAVRYGLASSRQPVMDKGVHVAGFFFSDVVADGEPFDFAGNFARKASGIKFGDQPDARLASQQVRPVFGNGVSNGADTTQTSHYNAATIHSTILKDLKSENLKRLQKSPVWGFLNQIKSGRLTLFCACWRSQSRFARW